MSFTGPVLERLEIRELVDRYGDAVARRDASAWAATWAEDGHWEIFGQSAVGRTALVSLWESMMAPIGFVAFVTGMGAVEIDGDRATARVYVTEEVWMESGEIVQVHGKYDDELVKVDGAWLFSHRVHTVVQQRALAATPA